MLSPTQRSPLYTPQDHGASRAADTSALVPDGLDLQGHRGARGLAPENTIPAFKKALDLGVTTLELDVVISGDGQVVVSHEPWMSNVICTQPIGTPVQEGTEREHNIYEMTYDEVKSYDCGTRMHPRFPEQVRQPAQKPLLGDVIEMAEAYAANHSRGPVFYNIETKIRPKWEGTFTPGPEEFTDAVLSVIDENGVSRRATLQSFDPRTLIVAHARQYPGRLALLVAASADNGVSGNLEMLPFTPDIYSPDHELVTDALLTEAHGRGMEVIPWTVNDPSRMTALVELGVDGLITDYPDRAVAVLPSWAR
ncbi:glycerophosphodiester phosphodiesterase [Longibacter salinarum]|uniref:Glycerophosphodiester phosphodiesterase n=1 Tax=Longibacter salinarum TaxID=1850348 RepID=A0A2A8CYY6_9BACT|nr:glycerophosphodiester phosphodiesterase family protein [Longibacter salinarum]PEN13787.1 glycerophosphodiester phosphodiesterase [Longibacter salinarum]